MKTSARSLIFLTALLSLAVSSAFAASSFDQDYSFITQKFAKSAAQVRGEYCFPGPQSKEMLDDCIKQSEPGSTKEFNAIIDEFRACGSSSKKDTCGAVRSWITDGGPERLTPLITKNFGPSPMGDEDTHWKNIHEAMLLDGCFEYIANVVYPGSSFDCRGLSGELKEGLMTGKYSESKLLSLFVDRGEITANCLKGTDLIVVRFLGPGGKKVVFEFNLLDAKKSQFVKVLGADSPAQATKDYFDKSAKNVGIFDYIMKMFEVPKV